MVAAPASTAEDMGGLSRQLASAPDFRLRVGAALSLGRIHTPQASRALVGALDDPHPAVRAAAAAALGASGDAAALPGLRAHESSESSMSVRSQIDSAIARIEGSAQAPAESARMVVRLGAMRNLSGVRGEQLSDLLRGATKRRIGGLPGVQLAPDNMDEAKFGGSRKLPALVLDGVVNRLAKGARGSEVVVSAQVEYVIRKLPDHALKGSVSGAAQAMASASSVSDGARLAELEDDALSGAVESAMRSAPSAFAEALRQ